MRQWVKEMGSERKSKTEREKGGERECLRER